MPSSKGTLFFNPSSGVKVAPAERLAFQDAAREAGLDVIHLTREVNCTQVIRERMARGQRLFIAAGGDGTINHVMQPLVHSEAVFGVIPAGTYNHFARDLGIPLDWREALEVALTGALHQVDTGRINERFFVNNVSLGLYPELVARREERGRDYPRWKARFWAGYHTFRKYPHVTLNIETEHHHDVLRTHVFMISNNSYDLSRVGIEAPRTTLSEGRLSIYWLPHLRRLELMRFAAHYLAGRVHEAPGFRSFRTSRMKVQTPRARLHLGIDGEVLTMETPLVIMTVPQSLVVRVPRT